MELTLSGSYDLYFTKNFVPKQTLAFYPILTSSGAYKVRDRGAEADSYMSTLTFMGTGTEINTFAKKLLELSGDVDMVINSMGYGERPFGPNVSPNVLDLHCAIISVGQRSREAVNVYSISCDIKIINPADVPSLFSTTTPSLSTLRLQDIAYEGSTIQQSVSTTSIDQTVDYNSRRWEQGIFSAKCLQTLGEAEAILNYFRTNRGAPFTFPMSNCLGGDKPFNDINGATPQVRLLEYSITPSYQRLCEISIKFALEPLIT